MPTLENFNATIVAKEVQYQLRKNLRAFGLCNTKYNGVIGKAGAVVQIAKPTALTVKSYAGTVTYETPDSTKITMTVDQQDYIAVSIEDVDQALTSQDLVQNYLIDGIYQMADNYDKYLFGEMADQSDASNTIATITLSKSNIIATADNADYLLRTANVPETARKFIAVSPKELQFLRQSPDFTKASEISDRVLMTGEVGEIFGMSVIVTNNLKTELAADIATDDPVHRYLPFGVIGALSTASAILPSSTETLRREAAFADGVRSLHFYGSKVFEPKMLGVIKNQIGVGTA